MKKELSYMIIEYTKKDEKYINDIIVYLEHVSQEIIDFFAIENLNNKIKVTLWDSLENFRNLYQKLGYSLTADGKVPEWICGFAYNCDVEALTIEEYKKTRGHENANVQDLMHLILHEFVHACHNNILNNEHYAWLSEGMATTISHQCDESELKFNATCDEMIHGCQNYLNYHTMFSYVIDAYGKDYVTKLIKDYAFLEKETPRLYKEVKEYVEKNKCKI